MKQMGLYLHIPFCVRKCAYCDFLSAPADEAVREAYVQRLIQEMKVSSGPYAGFSVNTVFFGGGTPSILSAGQLARLLVAVHENFYLGPGAEITVECNPGTLSFEKAVALREGGANRLSLGLQSAKDSELKALGRIHTFREFLESFCLARRAGFANINVDLMSALPGQTPQSWEETLRTVSGLRPEHISAYSLIIEETTPFWERYHSDEEARSRGETPKNLPSEEEERAMYESTEAILSTYGYHRYEISNYARSGFECRHNIGCWTRENYLGLGIGAASLIENVRFSNTASLSEYLNQPFHTVNTEVLSKEDRMEEFMFLGLRLIRGVSAADFHNQFGQAIEEVYGAVIREFTGKGLLQTEGNRIALTKKGLNLANTVFAAFLF